MLKKNQTLLSVLIASSLYFVSTAHAAFNIPPDLKIKGDGTDRPLSGPLHGTKPWIPKVSVEDPTKEIWENSIIKINFKNTERYSFADKDKDLDISPSSFKWYVFKDPLTLIEELKNPAQARTIEQLTADGVARPIEEKYISSKPDGIELKAPYFIYESESVGYVITPTTSNGFPDRTNKPLIVPSVNYTAGMDENGNPNYKNESYFIGFPTIILDEASALNNYIPARDIRGKANVNDDFSNANEWDRVKLHMRVTNRIQQDLTVNLEEMRSLGIHPTFFFIAEHVPDPSTYVADWPIDAGKPYTQADRDELAKAGLALIGNQPVFDAETQTYSIEFASNKPVKVQVQMSYQLAGDIYDRINAENFIGEGARPDYITINFIDQPSENLSMQLFDRGADGKGERSIVNDETPIYPNHNYEVAVLDNTNLLVDGKPTDVTHYFNEYINWAYSEPTLDPQFIYLERCDGTVMFPTQTNNENAEQVIIDKAPTPWPNFEQGLSLKPYINLPEDILSGKQDFKPIVPKEMNVCAPNKTDSNHVKYEWFD